MQDASSLSTRTQSNDKRDTRLLQTYQFGDIFVEQEHIFTFAEGIFGFEDHREFVLISEESTEPLNWLLSVDNPSIGFPVVNPLLLDINYRVPESMLDKDTAIFVIVTLANRDGAMSANMKAPVFLHAATQQGKQVILSTERYSPEYIIAASYENTGSKEGSYAGTLT